MCLEGYVLCPPLCFSSVHVRHCYMDVQYLRSPISLSLSFSLWPAFVYLSVLLYLPILFSISLFLPHPHVRTHPLSLLFCRSLSFVVRRSSFSSSYWTLFFALCCHTSMPLPAIRNAAAALERRKLHGTFDENRLLPPACLPTCVRPGQKSMLSGFACSMHMHF